MVSRLPRPTWIALAALGLLSALLPTSGAGFSSSSTTAFTFAAAAAATTDTIFDVSYTPATTSFSDTTPVTVGAKFRPKVNSEVTQIKFYKGASNTGTHVGKVYTVGGAELGSVTFTGETASGWQTATLSSPVAVTAWQVYAVAVYLPTAHYAYEASMFSADRDRTLLTAPRFGAAGHNNTYVYNGAAAYPFRAPGVNGPTYGVDLTLRSTAVARSGPIWQQYSNTLAAASTTSTVRLPEATTAGNTLLLAYTSAATVNTPAGWTLDRSQVNSEGTYLFRKTAVAGETSWTVTNTSSANASWWVAEMTTLLASPLDVVSSNGQAGTTTSWATPSITPSSGNRMLIAILGRLSDVATLAETYSWTNSFAQVGQALTSYSSGSGVAMAVATRNVVGNGSTSYTTTASIDTSSPNAILVSYKTS